MEILVWFSQWIIPLVGWWLAFSQFQLMAESLRNRKWGHSFQQDGIRSLLISFCHTSPESHGRVINQVQLPMRIRLLWLGLRSLSYGLIFLIIFVVLQIVPSSVLLLLALVFFIAAQWKKSLRQLALFLTGLGVFAFGFENLLRVSSQWTQFGETESWIFWLGENYLKGALIGFVLGFIIRAITRVSGVSWWTGLNFLLAGVASLGAAWGFILGDFLAGVVEDLYYYRQKDFQIRLKISLGLGLVFLILSAPFQILVMSLSNGEYSVQLRSFQLALMVGFFLVFETFLSLVFFHFYFLRQQKD